MKKTKYIISLIISIILLLFYYNISDKIELSKKENSTISKYGTLYGQDGLFEPYEYSNVYYRKNSNSKYWISLSKIKYSNYSIIEIDENNNYYISYQDEVLNKNNEKTINNYLIYINQNAYEILENKNNSEDIYLEGIKKAIRKNEKNIVNDLKLEENVYLDTLAINKNYKDITILNIFNKILMIIGLVGFLISLAFLMKRNKKFKNKKMIIYDIVFYIITCTEVLFTIYIYYNGISYVTPFSGNEYGIKAILLGLAYYSIIPILPVFLILQIIYIINRLKEK